MILSKITCVLPATYASAIMAQFWRNNQQISNLTKGILYQMESIPDTA